MVVVLAIILIMTSMGVFMSAETIPRYRTQKAARQFASKVAECRSLAVRTGRECSVWIVASDDDLANLDSNTGEYWVGVGNSSVNSTTWDYLPEDREADSSDDDQSQGIIDLGDKTGEYYERYVALSYRMGQIGGPGVGKSDRIVLSPRGFITNPATDFDSDGNMRFTFVNKRTRAKGNAEDYDVLVSRAGMVRIDATVNPKFDGMTSGTATTSTP